MPGKKRLRAALHAEAHLIAESTIRDLSTMAVQKSGGQPVGMHLHEFVECGVAEGLEVGLRIAVADIAAGRRLLAIIEGMSDGGGTRPENAERLLSALSV